MADSDGDEAARGTLFHGIRFWIAQLVPSRLHLIEKVKANGGRVVPLENNAEILIADHLRRERAPPGSCSYTWIEESIKQGELQDKEAHLAGPAAAGYTRPAGSARSAKAGGRNPYTAEDDRILYDWVTEHERQGGKVAGNEIYRQLEQHCSRHPWQSWRDRWIKYVSNRPAPVVTTINAPSAAPPSATAPAASVPPETASIITAPLTTVPTATASLTTAPTGALKSLTNERISATEQSSSSQVQRRRPFTRARGTSISTEIAYLSKGSNTDDVDRDSGPVVDAVNPETVESDGQDRRGTPIATTSHDSALEASISTTMATSSLNPSRPSLWQQPDLAIDVERLIHLDAIFTEDDRDILLVQTPAIQNIPVGKYRKAWRYWTKVNTHHTLEEWVDFYELRVLPEYRSRHGIDSPELDDNEPIYKIARGNSLPVNMEGLREKTPPPRQDLRHITPNHEQQHASVSGETPSRNFLPVVVVESPSARVKAHYNNSPYEIDSFSQRKRRKLEAAAPEELIREPALNERQNAGVQLINAALVEEPQLPSQAYADAPNPEPTAIINEEVVVVDLLDARDEHENEDGQDQFEGHQPLVDYSQAINVYESNEIPEGDEENVQIDANGSDMTPRRRLRDRSRKALAALPLDFKHVGSPQASNDIWHDIADIDDQISDYADAQNDPISPEASQKSPAKIAAHTGLAELDSHSDGVATPRQQRVLNGGFSPSHPNTFGLPMGLATTEYTVIRDDDSLFIPDERIISHGIKNVFETLVEDAEDEDEGAIDDAEFADEEEIADEEQLGEAAQFADKEQSADEEEFEDDQGAEGDDEAYEDEDTEDERGMHHHVEAMIDDDSIIMTTQDLNTVNDEDTQDSVEPLRVQVQLSDIVDSDAIMENHDGLEVMDEGRPLSAAEVSLLRARPLDTQATLNSDNFELDLEIPPPPDDLDEIASEIADMPSARFLPIDTQAILHAKTQPADLDVPFPSDADLEDGYSFHPSTTSDRRLSTNNTNGYQLHSSPPPLPRSTAKPDQRRAATPVSAPSPDDPSDAEALDADEVFISRQCALGSSTQDVHFALFRTSFSHVLAAVVLDAMRRSGSFPCDVPGIWTEEEDGVILGGDAARMRRLAAKYGREAFNERVDFLNSYVNGV